VFVLSLLEKLEATQPFSENEAWVLFKIIAFSEAIGWTILISAILINHFKLPGSTIAIPIGGQIHGTIFLIYFGVLITIYSSTGWSRKKFIMAAACSVPPFGTLIFEQWAAYVRQNEFSKIHFHSIALVIMASRLQGAY